MFGFERKAAEPARGAQTNRLPCSSFKWSQQSSAVSKPAPHAKHQCVPQSGVGHVMCAQPEMRWTATSQPGQHMVFSSSSIASSLSSSLIGSSSRTATGRGAGSAAAEGQRGQRAGTGGSLPAHARSPTGPR